MTPPPSRGDAMDGRSCVYLLKSRKDHQGYLGWTTNLLRRLGEHNQGLVRSTKYRTPLILVGYEDYANPGEAKRRESILKKNPRMYMLFKKRMMSRSPVLLAQRKVVG